MNSKEFVARSGLAVSTVRYYEKIGLLPAPVRGNNNYRSYEERHLLLARFIKNMSLSGFSLKDIGAFLEDLRQKHDLTDVTKDMGDVYRMLQAGSEKARQTAAQTLSEVKAAIGINYF